MTWQDVISRCSQCGNPSDTHRNCSNKSCFVLFIQWSAYLSSISIITLTVIFSIHSHNCATHTKGFCSPGCQCSSTLHSSHASKFEQSSPVSNIAQSSPVAWNNGPLARGESLKFHKNRSQREKITPLNQWPPFTCEGAFST